VTIRQSLGEEAEPIRIDAMFSDHKFVTISGFPATLPVSATALFLFVV
jgi:hypothetical protein